MTVNFPGGNVNFVIHFHLNFMSKAFAATLLSAFALSHAPAANAEGAVSPYAAENCKSGCVHFERDHVIYFGVPARTYRICAGNFSIIANVDGRGVPIAARFCADVSGQSITVDGGANAGLLPSN